MRKSLQRYMTELEESTAKRQKLESEIQIAKDIQMSMIPGSGNLFIDEPDFQLYACLRPARSVGGDLYYYQQDGDELSFILGDVSDKGVPAALFMAKTVTLYTRALKEGLSPGQTLSMMNDILAQNNDACMFVTALCGRINIKTGDGLIANAGHMPPIIKDNGDTGEAEIPGATALGLMEGIDYPDIPLKLAPQAILTLYTDGISEAHNSRDEQYTEEQLIEDIKALKADTLEQAGSAIIDSVDAFAGDAVQFDDITLLLFMRKQPAPAE
ncbi:MAG TPA: serine/threonine-protein phosphatase [Thiotrichales bacterium]|nr:serine/threonine-protein phosphatase [Thiotrichales bacterium]